VEGGVPYDLLFMLPLSSLPVSQIEVKGYKSVEIKEHEQYTLLLRNVPSY